LFSYPEFPKNLASLSKQFAARRDRRFEFHKSSQVFISAQALSLIAVRIDNVKILKVRPSENALLDSSSFTDHFP
jgi:hypothetical protein